MIGLFRSCTLKHLTLSENKKSKDDQIIREQCQINTSRPLASHSNQDKCSAGWIYNVKDIVIDILIIVWG